MDTEPSVNVSSPPKPHLSRVHPEPPKEPLELICEAPRTPKATEKPVQFSGSLDTSDLVAINLCLPTRCGTILASSVMSTLSFLGLLAFSFSEVGFFLQPKKLWSKLVLRISGALFLFYLPVLGFVKPLMWNFVLLDLEPLQPHTAGRRLRVFLKLQRLFVVVVMMIVSILPFEQGYFGLLPWFALGAASARLPILLMWRFLTRHLPSKSYGNSMLPLTGPLPLFGSVGMMCFYLFLRRLGGKWIGLLMPLFLSLYELSGTFLVTRMFTKKFVTEMEVRRAYSTNQGIAVSVCICNLHAMAEGSRLILLYIDNQENGDLSVWVPIISGVVWNVLMRIGCLERFLYVVSRRWLKPNNTGKLLRESGYCMGYVRFGSVLALILTRLCIGTSFAWDAPEILLLAMAFGAEVVEDVLSYILWRCGIDASPRKRFATDEEVEVGAQKRIERRLSNSSLLAVTPSAPNKADKAETKAADTSGKANAVHSALSDEEKWQERWKVRMEHDFKHGPEEFGRLPWWAHFVPVALAQFHTIFSLIVAEGLVVLLGLCESGEGPGLFWWPADTDLCA